MNLDRGGGLLAVVIPSGDVEEKSPGADSPHAPSRQRDRAGLACSVDLEPMPAVGSHIGN